MRALFKVLRERLSEWEKRRHPYRLTDPNGNAIIVDHDLIERAIAADIVNAAALLDENLVYQHNPTWVLGLDAMRDVIAMAQHYDDVEIALIAIAAATTYHDPEDL